MSRKGEAAAAVNAQIAANLRAELARHGKTQTWLAGVLGVSQSSVAARLKGDVPFTVVELWQAADEFGMLSIDPLLYDLPHTAARNPDERITR